MTEETPSGSSTGCLLRLVWTLAGPALILAVGMALVADHPPVGSALDYAFVGLALAAVLARLLDPAPPSGAGGRLRYVLVLAGAALAIFLIAHFVAPRVF